MNYSNLLVKLKSKKALVYLAIFGILLMLSGSFAASEKPEAAEPVQGEKINVKELENVLKSVKGAGKIKIFITYEDNSEKILASNKKENKKGEEVLTETEIITEKGEPYVVKQVTPAIRGILVTSTGAGSEIVKIRLLKSVKAATGVSASKIHIEEAD